MFFTKKGGSMARVIIRSEVVAAATVSFPDTMGKFKQLKKKPQEDINEFLTKKAEILARAKECMTVTAHHHEYSNALNNFKSLHAVFCSSDSFKELNLEV